MTQIIDLSVHQEHIPVGIRRNLCLNTGKEQYTFYFDLVDCFDIPEPQVLDGFVYGIIFLAMQIRQPLRVHGALSRSAIFNLTEYQSVWACWLPERYKIVEIIPDAIIELSNPNPDRAIAAFSGGIDSTFTAIRHSKRLLGPASYPLDTVLLVHGFDVPLSKEDSFIKLCQRIRPLIDELGLEFKVIRTNLKEASGQNWEDSHGAQLAASLHNFSHAFRYALIGSTDPYNYMCYPWGSSPITDHLLSGDQMRIVHDGAAYSRTDKLAVIAFFPTALKTLKVCWEGPDPEHNCGRCEKCLRTLLNFFALDIDHPPCFDNALKLENIYTIQIRNQTQFYELESIYQHLERREPTEKVLKTKFALDAILKSYKAKQLADEFGQLNRLTQDIKDIAPAFRSKRNTLFKILAQIDTPWLFHEGFKEYIKLKLKHYLKPYPNA